LFQVRSFSRGSGSCDRCCALQRAGGFPVGERHEVAVGCAGGVEVVGSFLEFLAQVEYLLFELAGAGAECLGVVGAPDSAGAEDFLAEDFRETGGEVGVLLAEPLPPSLPASQHRTALWQVQATSVGLVFTMVERSRLVADLAAGRRSARHSVPLA
jgi:hypothetical protein